MSQDKCLSVLAGKMTIREIAARAHILEGTAKENLRHAYKNGLVRKERAFSGNGAVVYWRVE